MPYLSLPPFGRGLLADAGPRRLGGRLAALRPRDLFALATASADEPRDAHYVKVGDEYLRTLLLEPEATNRLDHSDPNEWPALGSVSVENMGDGVARVTNQGTSGLARFAFRDADTDTYVFSYEARHVNGPTKIGGHTSPLDLVEVRIDGEAVTDSDNATDEFPADGEWHTVEMVLTGDGTAGSSYIYIQPGRRLAEDATFDIRRVQFEKGHLRSSFIPTYGAPATREADSLLFPIGFAPQPLSVRWRGVVYEVASFHRLFNVGGTEGRLEMYLADTGTITVSHDLNGTPRYVGLSSGSIEPGDVLDLTIDADATGGVAITGTINGVGVSITRSTGGTYSASYGTSAVFLGNREGEANANVCVQSFTVTSEGGEEGDLFSYRSGDDLSGATFSRASAATYRAKNPASLPALPDGVQWWDYGTTYVGGRIAEQTNTGAADIQGIDDAVGTSDGLLQRGGIELDGSDDRITLTAQTATGGNPRTDIIVCRTDDSKDQALVSYGTGVSGANGSRWTIRKSGAHLRLEIQGSGDTSSLVVGEGQWGVYGASCGVNGAEARVYANGVFEPVTINAVNTADGPNRYAGYKWADSSPDAFDGVVALRYSAGRALTDIEFEHVRQHAMAVLARRGIYMDPPTVEGVIQDQYVIHD